MTSGLRGGLLLYGANGYTGRLILQAALSRAVPVTIAGRRREAIEPMALKSGVDFRVFDLDDREAATRELSSFGALLLAAGPFSATSAPAFEACLAARTSYLDITGEVDVFEALFARDSEARAAGIAVLPGAGFDVVPSDCLAAYLSSRLPDAIRLTLAFRGFAPSPGTARTMVESLPRGGLVRRHGALVRVPPAWKTREVPFRDRTRTSMTVAWGDLATAWRSTGIPDIETYAAASPRAIRTARRLRAVAGTLRWRPLRSLVARLVSARVPGPTAEDRDRERSQLWGRVEAADGRAVEARMETLEGYAFTAESSVACAARILAGEVPPGVTTPSLAFGADFASTIRGTILDGFETSGSGAPA